MLRHQLISVFKDKKSNGIFFALKCLLHIPFDPFVNICSSVYHSLVHVHTSPIHYSQATNNSFNSMCIYHLNIFYWCFVSSYFFFVQNMVYTIMMLYCSFVKKYLYYNVTLISEFMIKQNPYRIFIVAMTLFVFSSLIPCILNLLFQLNQGAGWCGPHFSLRKNIYLQVSYTI